METDYSWTFEVQLSEKHSRHLSAGRWDSAEQAAAKAGEFLAAAAANGFHSARVTLTGVEEYRPLGLTDAE